MAPRGPLHTNMRIKTRLQHIELDAVDTARFWSKVDVKLTNNAHKSCWIWRGRKHRGYGQFTLNRKCHYAPRVAWTIFFGDPGDFDVLHKCDNPSCVNPYHLFVGTAKDNVEDCIKKGRFVYNNRNLTSYRIEAH